MRISELKDKHKGKTILIVGNGKNVHLTPPEKFKKMPAIAMNTIHLYKGWKPDYYVAVDKNVLRDYSEGVNKKLKGVPKVLPYPRLQNWHDKDVYWFKQAQGRLWSVGEAGLWQDDIGENPITYANSMHIAIKLAYYLGAKKILIIGMEHEPREADVHFWGKDAGMSRDQNIKNWLAGYKVLAQELKKRKVTLLNISKETHVSCDIIEDDDYKKYVKKGDK